MKKLILSVITILIIIVILILVIMSGLSIIANFKNTKQIDNVTKIYSDKNIQNRLSSENSKSEDLLVEIDGETVLGVLKIDKINFEGLIYEGTSLDTLEKGVGHFENSPYVNGNVCLAAHNTNKFWAKLNQLTYGDEITYVSFLGTKEYKVFNITQIDETDWALLEDTNDNILTLITCVKGNKTQRLCVQAIEIN